MGGSKKRKDSSKKRRRRFRQISARVLQEQSKLLLMYARRLTNGDEARAQDLVHSVFERILRYSPKRPINSIPHYLRRTLYNVWASSKPRVEKVSLDDVTEQVVHPPALRVEPETEKNLEQNEIAGRVFREMKTEYPELRDLLKYRVEGYTFPQIDKLLNKDPRFSQWLWRRFVLKVRKEARKPRRCRSDEGQAA